MDGKTIVIVIGLEEISSPSLTPKTPFTVKTLLATEQETPMLDGL